MHDHLTLGDILEQALAPPTPQKKEMNMRIYDVEIIVRDNGKKIEAIKNIRDALGIGLKAAKDFVEGFGWDKNARKLRLNERQLGRLFNLYMNNISVLFPEYVVVSIEEISFPRLYEDFSSLEFMD